MENSGSKAGAVVFIEVFVKVVPNRNQIKLQLDGIQASSDSPLVPHEFLHPMQLTVMVGLGITVPIRAANAELLHILPQLFGEVCQLLVMPLLLCLVTAFPVYERLFIYPIQRSISR